MTKVVILHFVTSLKQILNKGFADAYLKGCYLLFAALKNENI